MRGPIKERDDAANAAPETEPITPQVKPPPQLPSTTSRRRFAMELSGYLIAELAAICAELRESRKARR
jgi:hypothetical protein